jgi:hypothetical protein
MTLIDGRGGQVSGKVLDELKEIADTRIEMAPPDREFWVDSLAYLGAARSLLKTTLDRHADGHLDDWEER